ILEVLHRELGRNSREGGSLAVIMADLDHFKQINDTHGHITGDAMLRASAAALLACLRPYASIGRYGGEEFLGVILNCPASEVAHIAERMCLAVREVEMDAGGPA